MLHDLRSPLSGFIMERMASGHYVFTADEAVSALDISRGAFLDAAERLQRRKALLRPRQGFYVVVAPQFARAGAPPPSWYLDALMAHERAEFYVGLRTAAKLHGARHDGVEMVQVVTSKRVPLLRVGRTWINFLYRKELAGVTEGMECRETDAASMLVSSPALTALDLLRYPQVSKDIDYLGNVLFALGPRIDTEQMARLSGAFERAVVQRLGYLLDWLEGGVETEAMRRALLARGPLAWTELNRSEARDPDTARIEMSRRWQVVVRRLPDVDP